MFTDGRSTRFFAPGCSAGAVLLVLLLAGVSVSLSAAEATVPVKSEEPSDPQATPSGKPEIRPADREMTPGASEAWHEEMRELERQAQEEHAGGGRAKRPSGWSTGFWLAVLVALAGGAIWATIRFRQRLVARTDSNSMQIISRQAVDPKNSVIILRTRGRDYLLGVGPSGVSLLTLLPPAVPSESAKSSPDSADSGADAVKTPSSSST